MEMIDLKPCMEMKNAINELISRLSTAEERMSNRVIKLPKKKCKEKEEKKQNRTKIQGLWHNVKCLNMCIIEIPEEETFEEIKADMFPKII